MSVSRSLVLWALAGALCVLVGPATAVETKRWVHSNRSDFEKGDLKGLSVRSDGTLTLAPALKPLFDSSQAYLWALAVDSNGTVFAGGGGPGGTTASVFAIDASGKSRVVAELPSLQVQSIAVDSRDRVYVATLPDGKVFRLAGDGKFDVFYDPKTKYIWSLAFNSKGELFVATGDGGEIHKVSTNGAGAVFFRTDETHARSMVIDKSDNLVIGTEPGGLILRVSPAGEGFVIYQSGKKEVTAIGIDRDGVIYAGATGSKSAAGGLSGASAGVGISLPVPSAQITTSPGGAAGAARSPATPSGPPLAPPGAPPAISGGSDVYRIGVDNYAQRVWTDATEVVYSLGFDASNRPIIGTGNKGNIYRIDSDLLSTLLINTAPTHVTAFARSTSGVQYVATGNVGRIYQIGPGLEKQASYESEPLDGQFFSHWGRLWVEADLHGGAARLETRSGNLDRPQSNWSRWQPVEPATGRSLSPPARFLQYRVILEDSGKQSPEIREIGAAYMAKNVPPVFEAVEITPHNYKFQLNALLAAGSTPSTSLTLPPIGGKRASPAGLSMDGLGGESSTQTMQVAERFAGVRWSVKDPNDDTMQYRVEIRGAEEREWKLLKDELKEKFYSWDSSGLPDGLYVIRITATDGPSNPAADALRSHVESERFLIDNSAPQIVDLTGVRGGKGIIVKWRAADRFSALRAAEYSVDGREWVKVLPSTRISDALQHDYELQLPVGTGEQTIAVRVADEKNNQAVEKVVIR